MPQITYVQPDGQRRSIPVAPGATVMLTAVANDIAGIVAECGGAAMCATCHVYVDEDSLALLPPVSEVENEMLESAASGRRENSRLGCQIAMPVGVDEIVVHIPSTQN
ncbi:2Fe-2S iron-sulfur cluster binding domain-containing protein [Hydrogenophaga aromaticivorans]|jgi:2Fe-2S ferredoxin|uniref:2Fe-2S iron-sulfur cluster-binding protein n=1 Tax=Hydrogenophaga TaxID=47420 RepID=UPI001B3806C7|nr:MULTISPECIES: 2Fe-2S iron-sulfur cluster-binding protein [Hydrogenophaga]MDZ4055553.1 2Fe-2S iron-sulfur cluster-binding protein [Polynucleobacter sp.]MBQ0918833.1 2Fe-2S iron-sulfur cluster binding domain-containing protein [Hydrogenophaga aromaticivorans]MDO9481659.1 2Fe-2S iron-sulfur cluster-binding protein [Hydrogenophaga sp.]MDP3345552.1 2Fe-2S iron-sulfur cluster-binding protein [Hydrogenophaga sp.]MDP3926688.1 2Fe-2S iron-sulfur cluster-binding protein [Hydrogenophaga sp.]